METLEKIVASMAETAREAGVQIITGDTKVVPRGHVDGLFINTSGIGAVLPGIDVAGAHARPGDLVVINGTIGDHGMAITAARSELDIIADIKSDCALLNSLIIELLEAVPEIRVLRDPTRGGVATTLNEIARQSGVGIAPEEYALPVKDSVKATCDILGLDPLYLANEGKFLAVVPRESIDLARSVLKKHPGGREAAVLGEIVETPPGKVYLKTAIGGKEWWICWWLINCRVYAKEFGGGNSNMYAQKLSDLRRGKSGWLGYGVAVAGIHLVGLILLWVGTRQQPALLGLGLLAYTLGMRHAFDVDHIVAIDNTVRKLVQQKENPLGIGFYFSLGHSTVVLLMTVVTVISVRWAQQQLPQLQEYGGMVGTMVSGSFLLAIGLLNLFIWFDTYKVFRKMKRGEYTSESLDQMLVCGGLISRLAGPLYRFIKKSWHIYPMGFLFGLGFDTATEVAMLGMSASMANKTDLVGILALPVLFAAGMTLFDTADGIFMTSAYRWALANPLRKVFYNLSITGLSVVSALLIGAIEVAQVVAPKIGLNTGLWAWLQNFDLGGIGYLLVILFMMVWVISYGTWKITGMERL